MSKHNAVLSDLCQRIPDRFFGNCCIERHGRITVTRKINRIYLETSVREGGRDHLHDLFADIQAVNRQHTGPRRG